MAQWRKVIVSGSDAVLNQISASGNIVPISDNGSDLGSAALEFKDLYIDGTANIDTLSADALGANLDHGNYNSTNVDIDSGDIGAVTISAGLTWSAAQDLNNQNLTNVDIDSGAIDGVTIGGAAAGAITGTTIDATTDFTIGSTVITDDSIVMTPTAGDTATIAASTNGVLAITTVDTAAAAANITITADGTFEAVGTTVTLDSGGAINLEPAAGSAILLDGTISVDAGVVTGATSITSTAFVGTVDGVVGGNTPAAITGTTIDASTDFTIGSTVITDDSIVMTPTSGDTATIAASTNGVLAITTVDTAAAAANITITADGTFEAIGTTVTLDSGGAINLEPAAGSAILLDGTISVDAGVVTGATSITSTAFVGTIDGVIGGNTPAAITGTTITANTGVVPDANDGAYLGQAGTAFSDLFLAEGGVINWDSGDATLTQASNVVTLAGATLTGTLTNGLSVTANGGILMTSYNASAAVADLALDIDGMTDIGAAPATGDLFIIDDGANGTNRKSTIDRLATKFAGTGLTATSAVIAIDAADTTTTSIINSSLTKIGTNASQEYITFGTSDEVNTFVDNTERLSVTATGIDITGVATVSSNLTVGGNLDVNGTLTTIDTANSYVADKFMIVASGSTSATDGGFIVQGGVTSGYALGYDTGTSRWVLDNNLAHNATDIVPDAYVGTVELGTTHGDLQSAPTYGSGVGSIYVDTDDNEIWIYA